MKPILTVALFAIPIWLFGQCHFTTNEFIQINEQTGAWARYWSKDPITLDYTFGKVSVTTPKQSYVLTDYDEIIDEFPVQKFVFDSWCVMYSNTKFCSWIGVANENSVNIFINDPMLDYGKIVSLF